MCKFNSNWRENRDLILLDIGLGRFVELPYERAKLICKQRQKVVQSKLVNINHSLNNIDTNMRMVKIIVILVWKCSLRSFLQMIVNFIKYWVLIMLIL